MNYTDVTSLALSYADRNDSDLVSKMDSFLRIVEARANRFLKTQEMALRYTIPMVTGQNRYTLPSDYTGMREISIYSNATPATRTTLQYLSPEQMNSVQTGSRVYYTITAGKLVVAPSQETGCTVEIVYYRRLTPLSSTVTTNWVSDSSPDVYVFGLLVEISSFVKDPNAKQLWDERFKEALSAIQDDDFSNRWAGSAMRVRLG